MHTSFKEESGICTPDLNENISHLVTANTYLYLQATCQNKSLMRNNMKKKKIRMHLFKYININSMPNNHDTILK